MMDGEKGKLNFEMAEALDQMEKNLSSDNADFLEGVLQKLKDDEELTDKEQRKLEALYAKYFGEEEEKEAEASEEEDIDEDDFV